MRVIIKPENQKFVITALAALVAFLGFQAASEIMNSYQIAIFAQVSLYVYLFLVFWQSFVFDLHLKKTRTSTDFRRTFADSLKDRFDYLKHKHHWLQFQNYLVLPGTIYWATIGLLYLNPFDERFKQVIIVLSTLGLTVAFWYLKKIFYQHGAASRNERQMIFLVKIYASYLGFAASLGVTRYFGFGAAFFTLLVFCVTFLLFYQAFFQHHSLNLEALRQTLSSSAFLAILAYIIFYIWNVNYFSAALVLTAFYNTIWGIIHHQYIDRDLTRQIVLEYLAVLFVILVIVFSTTNFAERI